MPLTAIIQRAPANATRLPATDQAASFTKLFLLRRLGVDLGMVHGNAFGT
jgi:hypothetical protein